MVIARCAAAGHIQRRAFAQGAYPLLEIGRHHPFQFGLGTFHRRRGFRQPQVTGGEQAEGNGLGFFRGKHQRWQLETGHQPVAAVATTLAGQWNTQLFQAADVAAQGAAVDFQALRQFAAADLSLALQQFQQGQYAGGWIGHGIFSSRWIY
ncbi:hypothetical protein D9M68_779220 [compost metagenome]